jgi:hypothetical protein
VSGSHRRASIALGIALAFWRRAISHTRRKP